LGLVLHELLQIAVAFLNCPLVGNQVQERQFRGDEDDPRAE
jgi:hypothetical protein